MIRSGFNKDQIRLLQVNDKFEDFFYLYSSLPACTYVYTANAWCLWRPEEAIGSPATGVKRTMSCDVNVET